MTHRPSRRRGGALALLGVTLALVVPAGPARGQDAEPGYDFQNLHALADGVTVDFNLKGFLPIEDLVGLSSITSESHFGVGRSDSFAALPDPGDLILTLPGTLASLLGVAGLPDYPAAANADSPSVPVEDVQIVPDANLGAGRLHAEASDTSSSAFAHVGNQVDTIGLLPSFSIGSIRTTARTTQLNPGTLEAVATTTISGVRLLGGLLFIDQITSEVASTVANDKPKATATKVVVTGAKVAGTPVGITEQGIVGLGSAVPLAPVIDSLVKPLTDQGIKVRTTPSSIVTGARTAVARSGSLQIEVPLPVQGYPGILTISLGRALTELEVSALSDSGASFDDGATVDTGTVLDDSGSFPLPGLGDSSTDFGSGLPASPSAPSATPGGSPAGVETVTIALGRTVQDWDLTTLYRVLLLGGLALFVAGQVIVRSTVRPARRANDLRQLWRW